MAIFFRWIGLLALALVLGVVTLAGGLYVYLSPEEVPDRVAVPETMRMTSFGEVIGFEATNNAHGWMGVPFAQPPINELRWKAPRPPLSWEGQLQALAPGDRCVQLATMSGAESETTGSEDCLTLNIWAPALTPEAVETERLPVMFWIHGGGNTIGAGSSDFYNGALMATRHKVILVTVNYRLGPLGWFAHTSLAKTSATPEDASGNFGTLDLIAALTWVNNNIAAFGGDPGKVTIFGESAGGFNVMSLLASPLAGGLFHRAIVQSGGFDINTMQEVEDIGETETGEPRLSSREITARLLLQEGLAADREAALAMQDEMTPEDLALWLRSLTPAQIYRLFDDSFFAGMINTPTLFGDGVVLPAMSMAEVFGNPDHYNQVPTMLGTNRDEARLFMAFSEDYIELFSGMLPAGIKDLTTYRRDSAYSSDLWRAVGVDVPATLMSQHQPNDIYAYRFDADDWRDLGFVDLKELFGAAHGFEVFFVFGYFSKPLRVIFPEDTTPAVEHLSDTMMSYWAEFAYTGNPGRGRNGEASAWLPWTSTNAAYNLLDTSLDGGVRMAAGALTPEGVKKTFLKDKSFKSQEARCMSYKSVFRGRNFDPDAYRNAGCEL